MAKILVERGLSVDRLREVLDYNPETGVFTWKVRKANRFQIGDIAGCLHHTGYYYICVDGVTHCAHRMAWAYFYGVWPDIEVDHKNGIKNDNRISELRLATRKQNCENVKLSVKNKSGFRGVNFHKATNKWAASVSQNSKRIHLGVFNTPEEAADVVKAKREELFTHDLGRDAA